ncbi:hypothetical protein Clacol_003072 [Clathrus columnatus]|uniref:Uncharacterized protein n=1 Tax=Clathrus columnatus TaxID=1419009 RepID=A0AAV5A2J1_9AGAM|nr:hypothetical protein Clacol_003072 [Clathrus columnatus]
MNSNQADTTPTGFKDVRYSDLVCIGTGLSGIGLGAQLKRKLKFESMHFYDRNESYSGTWWSNHYPGAACDVPSILYSYSFHQNPHWSRFSAGYKEIQDYITSVVQKYKLDRHMTFLTECQEARWDEDRCIWKLRLQDLTTGETFVHECRIFISGVGTLVDPNIPSIPGANTFRGEQFHSARWRDDIALQGKNVVVIGNGSSANQLVPALQPQVGKLTQIIRSSQCTARQTLFLLTEAGWPLLFTTRVGGWMRQITEKLYRDYIVANAPKKYHEILIPKHHFACKRRVYDTNFQNMNVLKADNFELIKDGIVCMTEGGIQTTNSFYPADVIVYATGFQTNGGFGKLRVYGKNGVWLDEHWNQMGGRSAYETIAVHGFPNFFMLYGPNGGTAHTSILLMIENQIVAVIKVIRPVLQNRATVIEIKKAAYEKYTRDIQAACKKLVTNTSACTNWYITSTGWNGTVYPWSQMYYSWRCAFPTWSDWEYKVSKLIRV